jgi:hypothetical protein
MHAYMFPRLDFDCGFGTTIWARIALKTVATAPKDGSDRLLKT